MICKLLKLLLAALFLQLALFVAIDHKNEQSFRRNI